MTQFVKDQPKEFETILKSALAGDIKNKGLER